VWSYLALANAWRRTPAFILIGVEEVKGGRSIVHGVTTHLPDNNLQQFVNSKTNRPVTFSYEAVALEGKQVGVITIPRQKRPFSLVADYGKLRKDIVYARHGSSSATVSVDEATRMAATDAIDDWAIQELEAQRRERVLQQKLQRELHEAANRPNVICDFPFFYTIMYLRVINYGNLPARDISVTLAEGVTLPSAACLRHPIPVLALQTELLYWMFGPQEFDSIPRKLTLKVKYSDFGGHSYEQDQPFDFAYLGSPGGGGRGVDLSREENNPMVRALKRIAETLEKKPGRF
jgi:hypothetical protein